VNLREAFRIERESKQRKKKEMRENEKETNGRKNTPRQNKSLAAAMAIN